jgi:hypothetical protein
MNAPSGVQDPHVTLVVDELEQVSVAGDHVHRAVMLCRQRADDVISLVLGDPDHRNAEQLQRLGDHRHLHRQRIGSHLDVGIVRDLLHHPVRLVRRQQPHPPRRSPVVVPARDDRRRLAVAGEAADEVQEPADGVDGRPVGCLERVRHPEEGPEVQGGSI